MNLTGFFTQQGLALSAKLLSGSTLRLTRVVAGSGSTGDPLTASSLPQIQQELEMTVPARSGNTVVIPATLTAALASGDYQLTELGVYADDPDEGEILYQVYQLSVPVDIAAGSQTVLRFYLEETVSQDLDVTVVCSPAGLITEADFALVRNKVLAGVASNEEVHLTAEELVPYIKSLPRMLNSYLRVYVSGGTITEKLELNGFYGPGRIWIQREGNDPLTLTGCVESWRCKVDIILDGMTFSGAISQEAFVTAYATTVLTIQNCTVNGSGTSGKIGVHVRYGSNAVMTACTLKNLNYAVQADASCVLSVSDTAASSNTTGVRVYRGGIVLLCGTTPDLLGGSSHVKMGGIIAKSSGSLQ